jgi:hypothetical protein
LQELPSTVQELPSSAVTTQQCRDYRTVKGLPSSTETAQQYTGLPIAATIQQ